MDAAEMPARDDRPDSGRDKRAPDVRARTSAGRRDCARIRGNAYYQRSSLAASFRLLPLAIPGFDMLGIPESVHRLLDRQHGLILVSGPTGSGKSTTQAAIIDHLNATRPFHIITIEDPIEYVHRHKLSIVDHRR